MQAKLNRRSACASLVGWTWLAPLSALLCTGCGGAALDYSQYIPPEQAARSALETVLTSWQQGEASAKLKAASPAIEVVDSQRGEGQKLANYEIVGEISGEGPRRFTVRLTLEAPAAQVETGYVLLGNDPIWVFREEDYSRAEGM
jgi:hypothetical protein